MRGYTVLIKLQKKPVIRTWSGVEEHVLITGYKNMVGSRRICSYNRL